MEQKDTEAKPIDTGKSVGWISADAFRVYTVDRPQGVRSRDLDGWVRLLLEEQSPLPVDSLYWGYYELTRSSKVVIYCGWRRRIEQTGGDTLNHNTLALPAFFVPRSGGTILKDEVRRIDSTGHAYSLSYAEGEILPSTITRCPDEAETKATHAVAVRLDGRKLQFEITNLGDGSSEACTIQDWKLLRHADPRKNREVAALEEQERASRIFLRILSGVAAVLAVLALLQLLAFGWQGYLGRLSAQVATEKPKTEALQARFQLMERLQLMGADAWSPFDILSAVNGLRPAGIHFLSSQLMANERVEVRGEAATVETVNRFVNSLRDSPSIRSVELSNLQSRGRVTFTLTIEFRWPLPQSVDSASLTATTSTSVEDSL